MQDVVGSDEAVEEPKGAPRHLPVLAPAPAKVRASVVRLERQWFVLCLSRELGRRPIARTLQGTPLVLFRDGSGAPAALLDRCPHRNVPLSPGAVVGGHLECPYHGWRFDGAGECRHVPSLLAEPRAKARNAPSYPTIEQDGFVWVYATPGPMPESRPYRFPKVDAAGYTTVRQWVDCPSTMHAALENALDVPHTQFLHRGLFRQSEPRGITITAKVQRTADRVVAEYVGEPRPTGLVARILSPSGGLVTHFDRFILPSIAEVEYALGSENHFYVSSAMTPVGDFLTRIFAVVSFRVRILPGWLLKPLLKPLALRVFQQDAAMLALQTANIERFGGEQYASTEIDVLGPHIWRLLKTAERGGVGGEHAEEVRLLV